VCGLGLFDRIIWMRSVKKFGIYEDTCYI